jgi:putative OPT family oligopeptide transporter
MTTTPQATGYPDIVGAQPEEPAIPFQPYIPAGVQMRELTALPVIVGTILGMIFGASSLYLVLKVGLTVSASIPVAVISITLFKILHSFGMREATILENNVVQTAGSAGESIAFGVGVTMPAIMILGFDLEITRVMLVAILGGLLGILMMIPLRRALIVAQHGILKYPEGTACAEVLKAGASEESRAMAARVTALGTIPVTATSAKTIFTGFGIGVVYKTAMSAFRAWKDTPGRVFGEPLKAGSIHAEISPELLGVGYIIGPRIASIMAAGGVLAYLVMIPMIKFFGDFAAGVVAPARTPIREMGPNQIRSEYVLYIGAGAVAAAGIISVARSVPIIWHALRAGLKDVRGVREERDIVPRTDRDLPMSFVLGGIVVLVAAIVLARPLHMNVIGAILIVVFGFLFVTVSSRLTGEIGSTSNPISGMTYATLLLTSLIFLALGWDERGYYVTALSVGAIVCIAASNGGTTSQDLKAGFLVGATPRSQQIAILIGALASALILGPILLRLNDGATVYIRRTGFTKVPTEVSLDRSALTMLPAAPAEIDRAGLPAGNYRLLRVGEGPAGYPGLTPGEYLVNDNSGEVWKFAANFPPTLRPKPEEISNRRERLRGPQAGTDRNTYRVWHHTDQTSGHAGKYLVDQSGTPVYFVDPGINGRYQTTPEGSPVKKFDAPKAVLVSYIIKGILDRELPWGLVLLGAMIAITLEMSGIPSLAFAVGVYLPLSTSLTIFIGGIVRWIVDRYLRRKYRGQNLTEEQLVAETDKSPGVLMASGYIAGGAIAGIIYAFVEGVPAMEGFKRQVEAWATGNPFYAGPNADLLALIPFAILLILLYLTGREIILKTRPRVEET